MSLNLKIAESFSTYSVLNQYAPFLNCSCELPDCSIIIHNYTECAGFLKKNPAFSVYLHNDTGYKTAPETKRLGDYFFTKCDDGVVIRVNELIWVWVHQNWTIIDVVLDPIMLPSPNLHALIMRAYQYVALYSDALLVHAAAVSYQDNGILFCGVPGAGKSTQARLWEETYNAEAINNDQPCILYKNGIPMVSGTPWSGKEPCYKNVCAPVKAIVFVEKSMDNRVVPLSRVESYGLLYLNEYILPVQPEDEITYEAAIEKLVLSVPIYRQYCTMTNSAPKTLYDELFLSEKLRGELL